MARTLSGLIWVARFPASASTNDLAEPFRTNAKAFIAALRAAGAAVSVTATLRPKERAHLMHWSFRIARESRDPETVPAMAGVDIEWVHRDAAGNKDMSASRVAAAKMVAGYGIVFRPATDSHHIRGTAIDMDISWTSAALTIRDRAGAVVTIAGGARNGSRTELHAVGRSFGVIKLVADPPHWSSDGH